MLSSTASSSPSRYGRGFSVARLPLLLLAGLVNLQEINSNKKYSSSMYCLINSTVAPNSRRKIKKVQVKSQIKIQFKLKPRSISIWSGHGSRSC
uniref:Secreted protein n=2 Tax=Triticum urartu TaxID=4572 RepID=A0A8R7U8Z5_TRIUA